MVSHLSCAPFEKSYAVLEKYEKSEKLSFDVASPYKILAFIRLVSLTNTNHFNFVYSSSIFFMACKMKSIKFFFKLLKIELSINFNVIFKVKTFLRAVGGLFR